MQGFYSLSIDCCCIGLIPKLDLTGFCEFPGPVPSVPADPRAALRYAPPAPHTAMRLNMGNNKIQTLQFYFLKNLCHISVQYKQADTFCPNKPYLITDGADHK